MVRNIFIDKLIALFGLVKRGLERYSALAGAFRYWDSAQGRCGGTSAGALVTHGADRRRRTRARGVLSQLHDGSVANVTEHSARR